MGYWRRKIVLPVWRKQWIFLGMCNWQRLYSQRIESLYSISKNGNKKTKNQTSNVVILLQRVFESKKIRKCFHPIYVPHPKQFKCMATIKYFYLRLIWSYLSCKKSKIWRVIHPNSKNVYTNTIVSLINVNCIS